MGDEVMPKWPNPPGDMASEQQEYRYVLESYRAAMARLEGAMKIAADYEDGMTSVRQCAQQLERWLALIGPLPERPAK